MDRRRRTCCLKDLIVWKMAISIPTGPSIVFVCGLYPAGWSDIDTADVVRRIPRFYWSLGFMAYVSVSGIYAGSISKAGSHLVCYWMSPFPALSLFLDLYWVRIRPSFFHDTSLMTDP